MPTFWPQFVIPQDQVRTYELYDKYTGDTIDEFKTRNDAKAVQRNMEQMGEWQTRIRTHVSRVKK